MKILKTAKFQGKIEDLKIEDRNPNDFDKDQLEKGVAIEMEHTEYKDIATGIAMDHLEESGDMKGKDGGKYYDKLDEMEKEIKEEKKASSYFDLVKIAKKKKKKVNEYAVCVTSIGSKEGTTKKSKWSQDAKNRYDRCLKDINPKKHKPKKKS